MKAVATFQTMNGKISFTQMSPKSPVTVSGHVKGLTSGRHGLHVHEFGDIGACGEHWNPRGTKKHGGLRDKESHAGDLGTISNKRFRFVTDKITLYGKESILGRSVIVHSGEMGKRLECAVIGRSNESNTKSS